MDLPDLSLTPEHTMLQPEDLFNEDFISLKDMDYELARKVPGAIYSSERKAIILPRPTGRAAMVALALQPGIAINHPELVALRDTQIKDITPVDHATRLQLHIDAPVVHQLLLDQGYDWLEFHHEVNTPVTFQRPCVAGDCPLPDPLPHACGKCYEEKWPNQDTDLGYAAAILQRHHGFQLGWSRGYGKTLGTAALIEANHYRSVVVSPPNSAKFDTWVRELEHYLPSHEIVVMGNKGPEHRTEVLANCQRLYAAKTAFVLVLHHEALALVAGKKARDSGKGSTIKDGWKRLRIQWDLKVIDESHKLKTAGKIAGSQFHRAACKIPADNALALTGSLFENSWEEQYGTLHFLFPNRYQNPWDDWNLRHLDYVDGYGKVYVGILEGHDELMREELGVFTLVREKVDQSIHSEIRVELSPGQRKAYDDLVDTMLARLEDDTLVFAEAGVVQLTRLRQVAAGLDLLSNEVKDSSKINATVARIQECFMDDFFVATWHKAGAYSLADRLEELGYPVFVVTGDVADGERNRRLKASRDAVIERPQGRKRVGWKSVVVIGTIATLGESINLQHLNHVITVELSFNPALNRQVVDRVDRTGQTRIVYHDNVVAIGTVDETVVLPRLATKNAMRAMLLGRSA